MEYEDSIQRTEKLLAGYLGVSHVSQFVNSNILDTNSSTSSAVCHNFVDVLIALLRLEHQSWYIYVT
jgi:hypothetical protein